MVSPLLGAIPGAGAFGAGMSAGGAVADAAGSAWDFGSNMISNIGQNFDPSMIGGPFMPSFGGGSGGSPGQEAPLPLGLIDPLDMQIGGEMMYDYPPCG